MMGKTGADVLKEEGGVFHLRETLLMQLRKRFGKVPKETKATIEAATELKQLKNWLERFANAKSLEDVGINGTR